MSIYLHWKEYYLWNRFQSENAAEPLPQSNFSRSFFEGSNIL